MRTKIQTFIKKLILLLDDPENFGYIQYSSQTQNILIRSPSDFARYVLPNHFKHRNYSSFVRQLNLYKFQKVKSEQPFAHEYHHPHFVKDDPSKLVLLKRISRDKKEESQEKRKRTDKEGVAKTESLEVGSFESNQEQPPPQRESNQNTDKNDSQLQKVIGFFLILLKSETKFTCQELQTLKNNLRNDKTRKYILKNNKIERQIFLISMNHGEKNRELSEEKSIYQDKSFSELSDEQNYPNIGQYITEDKNNV